MHHGSLIAEPYSDLFTEYLAEADIRLDGDLTTLLKRRELQTAQLQRQPHKADHWIQRSTTHLQLRYPELAASDAYKALLWLEDQPSVDVIDSRSRAALIFCRSLFFLQCFEECCKHMDDLCRKSVSEINQLTRRCIKQLARLRLYVRRAMRTPVAANVKPGHEFGCIRAGRYPWMADELITRSSATRASMNSQLRKLSYQACCMKKSHVPTTMVASCYGIFATFDLAEEEEVFIEKPSLVAACNSDTPLCKFCFVTINSHERTKGAPDGCCSGACEQRFLETFGHNHAFSKVNEAVRIANRVLDVHEYYTKSAARLRLVARALVNIVQETNLEASLHPLDTKLMSGLVGYASSPRVLDVSFAEDIQMPIDILRCLDVSVFADLNFDMDVLFTIAGRIEMNSWEDEDEAAERPTIFVSGVNSCYTLLNHSCSPNIDWYRNQATGNIVLTALRDITAGEELFISYLTKEQLEECGQKRRRALQTWMGEGAHYCARCFPTEETDHDMMGYAASSESRKRQAGDTKLESEATPQRKRNGGATRSSATMAEVFEALPPDYDSSDEYLG